MSATGKAMLRLRRRFMQVAGGERLTRSIAALSRANLLRVLAYHDVPEPAPFERHLQHLATYWTPVSGEQVAAGWQTGNLPRRAVWVTFDDGYPGVIKHALPLLRSFGVPATLFVCPGYIDTKNPFWWEVIERAAASSLARDPQGHRWTAAEALAAAKRMPDPERRAFVGRLTDELLVHGDGASQPQLTTADLEAWSTAGLELGNHTYDHPCLHRCPPSEQERQIRDAHDWLSDRFPHATWAFSYPNGNVAAAAEAALGGLGYRIALGFDHRIARGDGNPMRISRLRVDATVDIDRFRAIVSGVHAAAYRITPRSQAPSERLRRL